MRTKTSNQALKPHNAKNAKRGFTLVELSVVIMLVAIVSTMTVSFSVLMNGHAKETRAEYEFYEDASKLKNALSEWVAEHDTQGAVFTVNAGGTLAVTSNGIGNQVSFSSGTLYIGDKTVAGLDGVDGLSFSSNGVLIKCELYRIVEGKIQITGFTFSLRCAAVEGGALNG